MSLKRPPGPKPKFIFDNAIGYSKNPAYFLQGVSQRYGDVARVWFPGFDLYLVNDPAAIESILKTNQSNFIKDKFTKMVGKALGNGLLISEGAFWRRQRKLVQPAFHHQRIAGYGKVFVEYTRRMLARWEDKEEINLHHEMSEATLQMVAKTLFNSDMPDKVQVVGHALEAMNTYFLNLFNIAFPFLPTPDNIRLKRAIKATDEIIYDVIKQRRASQEDPGDLLSMLLDAQDEDGSQMSDQQVRDEFMTLFIAGHETTALALTYALYLLAKNPEAWRKLKAEVDTVLGSGEAGFENMGQLKYTRWVIQEAMRLYPPAWSIGREALNDFEVGGYKIPKGAQIGIVQWTLHRDPRFFEDPGKFTPERWDNDFAKKIHPFAYIPFGGGTRICIGKEFAMMESILILATITQKYRLDLLDDSPLELVQSVTLRPKNPIPMKPSKA